MLPHLEEEFSSQGNMDLLQMGDVLVLIASTSSSKHKQVDYLARLLRVVC